MLIGNRPTSRAFRTASQALPALSRRRKPWPMMAERLSFGTAFAGTEEIDPSRATRRSTGIESGLCSGQPSIRRNPAQHAPLFYRELVSSFITPSQP
jgi:hypothetical protein